MLCTQAHVDAHMYAYVQTHYIIIIPQQSISLGQIRYYKQDCFDIGNHRKLKFVAITIFSLLTKNDDHFVYT